MAAGSLPPGPFSYWQQEHRSSALGFEVFSFHGAHSRALPCSPRALRSFRNAAPPLLQSQNFRADFGRNSAYLHAARVPTTWAAGGPPPRAATASAGAAEPAETTSTGHSGSDSGLLQALLEPISARRPAQYAPQLMNADFMPTLPGERIMGTWDICALWVGLVVGVPTWFLAGSLVQLGMSWRQGITTVFLGNVLVLLPMILNGHPGCKYGVPFPVLSRAAFGVYGANVPSLLRGLVACGWFGIQTWIGGQSITQLLHTLLGSASPGLGVLPHWSTEVLPPLGISGLDLVGFLAFWSMQVAILWNGIESIKSLEAYSAPILIGLCVALLVWAYVAAGGFGPMLSSPSQFAPGGAKAGTFWRVFFPALTANIGFWATLSLNIPDFTRYAESQRAQLTGQIIGLPGFMAAFSFVGLAVTSATTVIFGRVISDPVVLLGQLKGVLPSLLAVIGLTLATLTTNIAANVVAPANALVNLAPSVFTFRRAALLTAVLGVVMAPWRLVQSADGFIFRWLIAYSALLGPVAGIVIADYFVLRKRVLDIDALFSADPAAEYWYSSGFNVLALLALVLGVLPNLPGFVHAIGLIPSVPAWLQTVYGNAWIVGFLVSGVSYLLLMGSSRQHNDSHASLSPGPL